MDFYEMNKGTGIMVVLDKSLKGYLFQGIFVYWRKGEGCFLEIL